MFQFKGQQSECGSAPADTRKAVSTEGAWTWKFRMASCISVFVCGPYDMHALISIGN